MTLNYYDENSRHYFTSTKDIDLSEIYAVFLQELPEKAYILDAGCGSGRDSKYFIEQGYTVYAIDGSAQLAKLASEYIGQAVNCMTFEEIDMVQKFDGIWACASLLHVPRTQMFEVFQRFTRALKLGGIWYVSYKWGTEDRYVDGRLFTDYDANTFTSFLSKFPQLEIVRLWKTEDSRKRGNDWLNVILRKRT